MFKKTIGILILLLTFSTAFSQNPFLQIEPQKKEIQQKEEPKTSENWLLKNIISIQNQMNEKISSGLEELKNTGNFALFLSLCLIAFLYGLVHSLGPGHGKVILINWVLSCPKKIKTILFTSVLAAVLHALSSLVIILVTYLIMKQFFSMESEKIQNLMKIPAGVILAFVGIFFIINVFLDLKKRRKNQNTQEENIQKKNPKITPIWVILSIGIVPCPISTLIMIFSLTLGLLVYGIVFVLFFAVGMGLSLLIIGLMTYFFREKILIPRFKKIQVFVYLIMPLLAGLIFIFSGLAMIF